MAQTKYKLDFRAGDTLVIGDQTFSAGEIVELDSDNPAIDGRFVPVGESTPDPEVEASDNDDFTPTPSAWSRPSS